ncbi:CDP-diacylglycerol--glycerol-3-phosphate 3-phosphatidyltransferase [Actinoplanes lutulentus]|uniref:CDP-diacylglycerol--glycerol-3-phosphate 3-phosphatidyltransferase n=1 Tax=Actinoplanes lutulentus TaxID=1287878 RepID=A0A327ZK92_9ACTN|nr:CDP-alcohol phosphatidyltransferase family protein [Actinoplanes lutulentus]MBB2941657.1 CDP-diacylglycerol--glycerol-3-phosphate 3-phosphatidyltransferase [Actinoplanes lutulentus]RAK39577.1 CDP-diacylglycerol--glycerol-3-phosphate 3-phosphatidyltransferase [Actinoplanes lutulentus]
MTWDEYATAWSALHGGFDPRRASPLVRGWVLCAYRIGSFLGSKRISPLTVTIAGVILCLAVPLAALAGRGGLVAGALLVLLAAVADGLDGAVAVVTGRVSRAGFVYDSVADRVGELGWLAAFWVAGAPGPLVVAAGAASWLHEYVRARAAASGMAEIGAVTVGERPTRVSVSIVGLLVCALSLPAFLPVSVWLVLQIVGFAQLVVVVRRSLR